MLTDKFQNILTTIEAPASIVPLLFPSSTKIEEKYSAPSADAKSWDHLGKIVDVDSQSNHQLNAILARARQVLVDASVFYIYIYI